VEKERKAWLELPFFQRLPILFNIFGGAAYVYPS
jgi:hypothetical protein